MSEQTPKRWISSTVALLGLVLAALTLVASSSSAASSAARAGTAKDFERCCFELEVSVGSLFGAEYPCDPPGYDCVYGPWKYPNGEHFFSVSWYGKEIVSYHVHNGRPLIGEVFAAQARVRVPEVLETSAWQMSNYPDEDKGCKKFQSTDPKEFDPSTKDGFMKSWSLLEFVNGNTLEVHPGPGLDHVFANCGLGVDDHGANGSRSSWGGMNQPWVWEFKSWPSSTWTGKRAFHKTVLKTLPGRVLQPGGFCWRIDTQSSLIVGLYYFPKSKLKRFAKTMNQDFPITAKKLHTLESYSGTGSTYAPGAENCDG